MRTRWLPYLLLLNLVVFSSVQAAELPSDIRGLRQKYASYLQGIESGYTNRVQLWRTEYARTLNDLGATLASDGRTAEADAMRKAAQTALTEDGVDAAGADAPPELVEQLRDFTARRAQIDREKNESILKALQKYDGLLAERQKRAEGHVDVVLAIKEERERAAQDPVVTAAEFELAVLGQAEEAPAGEPSVAAAAGGPAPSGTSASAPAPVASFSEARVYEPGMRPPSEDAASYKKLTLSRTEHAPLASPVVVNALGLDKTEAQRDGTHYRREQMLDRWFLRLQLRTTPAAGAVPGPLVTVQYYIKNAQAQGRVSPELISVKRVELKQLVPEMTTVDFPAIETMMVRERMGVGAVWSSTGKEFYGVIISIFDADRKLIHQTASIRGLLSEASPNLPSRSLRERVEEARVQMEMSRAQLNEARMHFFANQHEEVRRNAFLDATQKFEVAQNAYLKLKLELDTTPPGR